MSTLEQALTDYLQLRHSLGHELAEAAWHGVGKVAVSGCRAAPTRGRR